MLERVDMLQFEHRTYVVSSGDSLSVDKAQAFERRLQEKASEGKSTSNGGPKQSDDVPIVASRKVKQNAQRKQLQQQESSPPLQNTYIGKDHYTIDVLPRARRIHQSILTTPYSCAITLYAALSLLHNIPYPDIIITNGPATGVIVILASMILRFFDIADVESEGRAGHNSEGGRGLEGGDMRTIYVESWARVRKLSLSGRMLVKIVDRFLVQWEGLEQLTNGKGEYRGVLI